MIRVKKKIGFLFLALLCIYGTWLFYNIFATVTYSKPDHHDPLEAVGVYHIHSTLSDGRKSVDEIARTAAKRDVDFIILTDHGNPNHNSRAQQGEMFGIHVLAGSELSVNRGHLVALGEAPFPKVFSRSADEAVIQINQSGGLAVVAHPYSKTRWSWGAPIDISGMEILSGDSLLRNNYRRILFLLPAIFLRPRLPLLKLPVRPEINLMKWDYLNQTQVVFGYYSTDAHLLYHPLFCYLRLHLLLDSPLEADFTSASRRILDCLRRGRFYNSIDGAAPASGFRFHAELKGRMIHMGEELSFAPSLRFIIQTPHGLEREIVLVHNGNPIPLGREQTVHFEPQNPGVYRVEVYLREKTPLAKSCPWILSNPIFLREIKHDKN